MQEMPGSAIRVMPGVLQKMAGKILLAVGLPQSDATHSRRLR